MLNAGFGIGQALGPLTGAGLYELFGFRQAMDITAYFVFAYSILYFVCASGCHAIALTCKNCRIRKAPVSEEQAIVRKALNTRHSAAFRGSVKTVEQSQAMRYASLVVCGGRFTTKAPNLGHESPILARS